MTRGRDDFIDKTKNALADRVGSRCSRPGCRAATSGPQLDISKALNVGVAAHITAAAPGGPRFDSSLSVEQRASASNGIWLCQNCAKLVDNDPVQFSADTLREWKAQAELDALQVLGKTSFSNPVRTDVIDKWVSLGYVQKSGIAEKLKAQGFELCWMSADRESERIDFEGWEYVLMDQPGGKKAQLKIRHHPAIGGYLVLLKRFQP